MDGLAYTVEARYEGDDDWTTDAAFRYYMDAKRYMENERKDYPTCQFRLVENF